MAFLRIVEYGDLARDLKGNVILAGKEPALAVQKLVNTGGAVSSAVFNAQTRFIMVSTDSICAYAVGPSAVATILFDRLGAGERLYMGVNPTTDRLSVIVDV